MIRHDELQRVRTAILLLLIVRVVVVRTQQPEDGPDEWRHIASLKSSKHEEDPALMASATEATNFNQHSSNAQEMQYGAVTNTGV